MIISVISKKGGVGKTPLAFSLAKDLELYLQSNDNSCIEHIYPGKAKVLEQPQVIDNCVYDFGGFVAAGILEIVKKSDLVLIPCTPNLNAILRTYESANELKKHAKICVVATDYADEKEKRFLETELARLAESGVEIFYLKKSKAFVKTMITGASLLEICEADALARFTYKELCEQYKKILNFIKKAAK